MKIIILMYHDFLKTGKKSANFYQINRQQFVEQMDIIKSNNRNVISAAEHASGISLMLTFDDGHISNYETAAPVLEEYGFMGHFFVTVGKIGHSEHMRWEHLRSLKNKKHIIGSHGMTHRLMTRLSQEQIKAELKNSKDILEDKLRCSIDYFSIPRGFYNEKIIQLARATGYKAVFTSDLGINTRKNIDIFKLKRIPIKRSLSLERFMQVLNGKTLFMEKAQDTMKKVSQALIGIKNYEKLTLRAYR